MNFPVFYSRIRRNRGKRVYSSSRSRVAIERRGKSHFVSAPARYALAAGAKMWTAAKRAASGLPTARSALKFTGGMFGFSLLCSKIQGHNHNSAHWAGDLKKKTWSSEFDVKDGETSKTKTKEIYFRTDPETGYRYPVGVIRSKPTREDPRKPGYWFQPVESDATGWENATWETFSVNIQ